MIASGQLTATALTDAYLRRIAEIDDAGPTLNAIIEINPDARAIAANLDSYFQTNGVKGSLHGLPVLLKANIDTGDRMATSAGSLALADHFAETDALLVSQLREAGAVILGKTNLSEWANFRSTKSSSGWSSLGGQVHNPYVLDRNPCGSSSGSGVAVAASLAALAVGTETDGSIVCPAGANGVVGIKPTVGTVSRQGIIPIAHSQDTAGPIAKTVTDAALLLEAMTGHDQNDPGARSYPIGVAGLVPDPADTALVGRRIGVLRTFLGAGTNEQVEQLFADAIETLGGLGATIVDPIEFPLEERTGAAVVQVLLWEFKADLNKYLASHPVPEDRNTLEKIIVYNERHRERVMPIFGQELFHEAAVKTSLNDPQYREALAASVDWTRQTMRAVFAEHKLDTLIAPTNAPAWETDWQSGDHFTVSSSGFPATSGYPNVTVPAGYVDGLPVGVSFMGLDLTEAALIQTAYAFEQATKVRVEPSYRATLEQ